MAAVVADSEHLGNERRNPRQRPEVGLVAGGQGPLFERRGQLPFGRQIEPRLAPSSPLGAQIGGAALLPGCPPARGRLTRHPQTAGHLRWAHVLAKHRHSTAAALL